MKKQNNLVNLALAAMFLALAYVIPFLTGQVPEIGSVFCPMHIPVIICGFVCGAPFTHSGCACAVSRRGCNGV